MFLHSHTFVLYALTPLFLPLLLFSPSPHITIATCFLQAFAHHQSLVDLQPFVLIIALLHITFHITACTLFPHSAIQCCCSPSSLCVCLHMHPLTLSLPTPELLSISIYTSPLSQLWQVSSTLTSLSTIPHQQHLALLAANTNHNLQCLNHLPSPSVPASTLLLQSGTCYYPLPLPLPIDLQLTSLCLLPSFAVTVTVAASTPSLKAKFLLPSSRTLRCTVPMLFQTLMMLSHLQ